MHLVCRLKLNWPKSCQLTPLPEPKTSFNNEVKRAAKICAKGKEAVVSMFQEARMGNAIEAEAIGPLVNEISNSILRNPGALISLARLKTADDYTYMHSVAVCALMIALARQLGLDEQQTKRSRNGWPAPRPQQSHDPNGYS